LETIKKKRSSFGLPKTSLYRRTFHRQVEKRRGAFLGGERRKRGEKIEQRGYGQGWRRYQKGSCREGPKTNLPLTGEVFVRLWKGKVRRKSTQSEGGRCKKKKKTGSPIFMLKKAETMRVHDSSDRDHLQEDFSTSESINSRSTYMPGTAFPHAMTLH